jgi:pimeloyl-ACP methyl ester carboxylesterase
MTRHEVDIAGRRLSWLESGDGAPLVLLHAFPLDASMWAPQHATTPSGWRLVTPDLRGFGATSGPPATSVDDHADDVLALMRHLSIERAVIGGLSMGGYVAFAIHRHAAQRFRALVLADTRAEADTEQARAGRLTMQRTARDDGARAVADAMLPRLLRPAAQAAGEAPTRLRELITSNRIEGIIDGLEALRTRPDSTPTLATIVCPTLIIVGADDELTPVAMSETMQRGIRGSTLAVVPSSGHLSNLEQPQAFDAALLGFLRRL